MLPKVKSVNNGGDEDLDNGLLLHDIQEISRALYLHKSVPETLNSPFVCRPHVAVKAGISVSGNKLNIQDLTHKDKKPSRWKWKPLKALSHVRNHRFNCCFFLHVHDIEGLPSTFSNVNLCVTWKRKGRMLETHRAPVCAGSAKFEETLMHHCTVSGNRNGPHNSAKYQPKLFLLHASVIGASSLDIGKHWIDLTRLLPVTLEELKSDERSSGKWTTSFKLTGKASGAILNVSFGFSMMDDNSFESGNFVKFPYVEIEHGRAKTDRDNSRPNQLIDISRIPTILTKGSDHQSESQDIMLLDECFPNRGPELAQSISLLYRKLDKEKMRNAIDFDFVHDHSLSLKLNAVPSPECAGRSTRHDVDDAEFSATEHGKEISTKDQINIDLHGSQRFDSSLIEIINAAEIFDGEETAFDDTVKCNSERYTNHLDGIEDAAYKEDVVSINEPTIEELDMGLYNFKTPGSTESDSLINNCYDQEKFMKTQSGYKMNKLTKLLSLADDAESIENDFLAMLCSNLSLDELTFDGSLQSPRELFLREGDQITRNNSLRFEKAAWTDNFDLSLSILSDDQKHGSVAHSLKSRRKAKLIENLETEALMDEWGLNEKTFQNPACASSGGFGSPVYVLPEEPIKLPSLGEGLGPFHMTKDGGFVRSMSPVLFRDVNNGSRLILQASAPAVLPTSMGITIMEIVQYLAGEGIDKMSIQVDELMPLENITGETIQQVVLNVESVSDDFKRFALHPKFGSGEESTDGEIASEELLFTQSSDILHSSSTCVDTESDYVSFENLVPLAITNVECLLIEGLKIQSGLADHEAPSEIEIHFTGSSVTDKTTELCGDFNAERASGLKVPDSDDLLSHSVSLEDRIRQETECLNADDETHEAVLEPLASHHTAPFSELGCGPQITGDERIDCFDRCGALNNKFIMGLRVQLRNPLRDYEMVGSSMLALVEVEIISSTEQLGISERNCKSDLNEKLTEGAIDFGQKMSFCEKGISKFKVLAVHLAGLDSKLGNKELWGSHKQLQAGSRWLLSSGMLRTSKNHISSSNAVRKFSSCGTAKGTGKTCPRDIFWSISSCIQGEASTWGESHMRNPDVIFAFKSAGLPE